ncbi:MAG TPA: radical SAM protein [Phycisphaerae bacterium]|nr:radical SAM protein [Phycisphaerae bacterium]HNU44492.1 radical SAM protein [Phycisphaerae bacterium]
MTFAGFRKALHQLDKIRYRPVLLLKIARAYGRTLLLRRPTLRICEFSITAECQSRCGFCYASRFHRPGAEPLSVEEIRSTWQQAKALGAFSTVVFGGEPLLHPRLLDIVGVLEPRKHIVTLTTNAIGLTEDLVIELKRRGVFLLNLSLNSLDPELNDRLRGYPGHHARVMEAITLCKKHGLDVFLPVATAKPYWQETLRIVEFARRQGVGVTINLMCAMGRAEGKHAELFDDTFWRELRALYDTNPGLRSDYDVNLDLRIGCPAAFEKIHVAPYGDVTGCSMNPVSFGNVRETPLAEIVARMRRFHHFAKRHPSCIVAVDRDFIETYMDYAAGFASLPYPVEANPAYGREAGEGVTPAVGQCSPPAVQQGTVGRQQVVVRAEEGACV